MPVLGRYRPLMPQAFEQSNSFMALAIGRANTAVAGRGVIIAWRGNGLLGNSITALRKQRLGRYRSSACDRRPVFERHL